MFRVEDRTGHLRHKRLDAMTDGEGRAIVPLSPHDREVLSGTFLRFLDELKPLLLSGFGEEIAGSRAEQLVTGSFASTSQGPHPGRNAIETVLFATLAGLDHSRLLMSSIRQEGTTFALATLTRGAIEAYARAWWLIEDESNKEVLVRWLSAIAKELQSLERFAPNTPLKELRGRDSSPGDEREKALNDIERLTGSRKPRDIGYASLATALQGNFDSRARMNYSHLSGVAHGESLGINGFIGVDDVAHTYDIALPERWGMAFVSQAFRATAFTARKVLVLVGRDVGETHPCVIAHDEASTAIATIMARQRVAHDNAPRGQG